MARTPASQSKSVEQIVREVGTYTPDAFQFVREGLTYAAERVHGPMSRLERRLARWMAKEQITPDELRRLYQENRLPEGVRQMIDQLGGAEAMNRHVTGQQLCLALRDLAIQRWGWMARIVLAHWGVYSTLDFGKIVYALVENQVLSTQPSDSIRDFERVFDFREAFDRNYRIDLNQAAGK